MCQELDYCWGHSNDQEKDLFLSWGFWEEKDNKDRNVVPKDTSHPSVAGLLNLEKFLELTQSRGQVTVVSLFLAPIKILWNLS